MKGRAPRAIVIIPCSGTTALRTKRFMPYGGVIIPISHRITKTGANQSRLKPRSPRIGAIKGKVNINMEMEPIHRNLAFLRPCL